MSFMTGWFTRMTDRSHDQVVYQIGSDQSHDQVVYLIDSDRSHDQVNNLIGSHWSRPGSLPIGSHGSHDQVVYLIGSHRSHDQAVYLIGSDWSHDQVVYLINSDRSHDQVVYLINSRLLTNGVLNDKLHSPDIRCDSVVLTFLPRCGGVYGLPVDPQPRPHLSQSLLKHRCDTTVRRGAHVHQQIATRTESILHSKNLLCIVDILELTKSPQ